VRDAVWSDCAAQEHALHLVDSQSQTSGMPIPHTTHSMVHLLQAGHQRAQRAAHRVAAGNVKQVSP
jgi:hypothetical protein